MRTVVIKQVITETEKEKMMSSFLNEAKQYEREIEQLTFHMHKASRTKSKYERNVVKKRYENEIEKKEKALQSALFKLDQLEKLDVGAEIEIGTAESIVQVNVGDPYPQLHKGAEIVIKDGVINAIRERRNEYD